MPIATASRLELVIADNRSRSLPVFALQRAHNRLKLLVAAHFASPPRIASTKNILARGSAFALGSCRQYRDRRLCFFSISVGTSRACACDTTSSLSATFVGCD